MSAAKSRHLVRRESYAHYWGYAIIKGKGEKCTIFLTKRFVLSFSESTYANVKSHSFLEDWFNWKLTELVKTLRRKISIFSESRKLFFGSFIDDFSWCFIWLSCLKFELAYSFSIISASWKCEAVTLIILGSFRNKIQISYLFSNSWKT